MSLKAQLAKSKALWNKAKESKSDFDSKVTDGVYVGKITKAELGESESSGQLRVMWSAVISGGEFKGEKVTWWSSLKTEQNFMYLQRDLKRLGVEVPEDINELGDAVKEIEKEKPAIRFKVKIDGEFLNVRVLKKLSEGETPEDADDGVAGEAEPPEDPAEEADEEATEEAEEESAEETEASLEVGTRVAFDFKDEEIVGEVAEVDNEKEVARIKGDNGKKYKGIRFDKLRPAPKTKVKKK